MTPEYHCDAAVQLLADVNDTLCDHHEALILAQCAIAHALLGLLEVQMGKESTLRKPRSDCRNCGAEITYIGDEVWRHIWNDRQCCYDVFKPEIATPRAESAG